MFPVNSLSASYAVQWKSLENPKPGHLLQWRGELDEILQLAADDTDQWVAMVGSILRSYPATGSLNSDIDDHHTFFHQVQADLKKLGECVNSGKI